MPEFNRTSRNRLATCHPYLQLLAYAVVRHRDCTVVCGHRGEDEQERAFREGRSKKRWPDSKHNGMPSDALDLAPWFPGGVGIPWKDRGAFILFAGYVLRVADELAIPIRYGGDWDSDGQMADQSFMDLPHFERALG